MLKWASTKRCMMDAAGVCPGEYRRPWSRKVHALLHDKVRCWRSWLWSPDFWCWACSGHTTCQSARSSRKSTWDLSWLLRHVREISRLLRCRREDGVIGTDHHQHRRRRFTKWRIFLSLEIISLECNKNIPTSQITWWLPVEQKIKVTECDNNFNKNF